MFWNGTTEIGGCVIKNILKYKGSIKEASRFSGTLTCSSRKVSNLSGREGRSFILPSQWKQVELKQRERCHEAYPWLHGVTKGINLLHAAASRAAGRRVICIRAAAEDPACTSDARRARYGREAGCGATWCTKRTNGSCRENQIPHLVIAV